MLLVFEYHVPSHSSNSRYSYTFFAQCQYFPSICFLKSMYKKLPFLHMLWYIDIFVHTPFDPYTTLAYLKF